MTKLSDPYTGIATVNDVPDALTHASLTKVASECPEVRMSVQTLRNVEQYSISRHQVRMCYKRMSDDSESYHGDVSFNLVRGKVCGHVDMILVFEIVEIGTGDWTRTEKISILTAENSTNVTFQCIDPKASAEERALDTDTSPICKESSSAGAIPNRTHRMAI